MGDPVESITESGTRRSLRDMLAPPDALTAGRIRHDARHKCTRSAGLHRTTHVPGAPDTLNRRIPLHRAAYGSVIQNIHPRTLVPGRQPLFANGTPRCLGLRFWARFFDLQGYTDEKGVQLYLVRSRQPGRFTQALTITIEFTQPRRRRGTVFPTVW